MARTEIGYARSIANLRSSRQFICSGEAAIMILVMRKQIIWPQTIKVTTARAQLCKYDVE